MQAWLVFLGLAHVIGCSLTSEDITFPCETPDGEQAYCVSSSSCPHLIEALSTNLVPEAVDYAKRSICLGSEAGEFMVCCGSPKNFSVKTSTTEKTVASVPQQVEVAKEPRREYVRTKLLPSQRICGQQHTDDRYYDGNETALDEFPWIAYLENNVDVHTRKCNGVLISSRYVLTAGYCGGDAVRVRLGQHSTQKNVTCLQESSLFIECTEPVVIRSVEKRILRGNVTKLGFYNLMLLRLNESVKFSEYIRPICLPIDGSKRPTSENYLTFSGFGAEDESEVVKKRITYNLTSLQACYDADETLKEEVEKLTESTLACLVPPFGNTLAPCYGESGAPLMYKYKYKWFVDAVFVDMIGLDILAICSTTAPITGLYITPTVMDWIFDNIED